MATSTSAPARESGHGSRRGLVAVAGVLLVLLCAAASVFYGGLPLGWGTVLRALSGSGHDAASIVVREIRLPRTALGLMVGACLGVAGALMQALTGNPLADASLLGINGGASFAAVLAFVVAGVTDPGASAWIALAGAGAATGLVHLLARRRRRGDVTGIVLGGAVLASLLSSAVAIVLTTNASRIETFLFWEIGSLSGRTAAILWHTLPFAAVGLVVGLSRGAVLNVLSFGTDTARALGVRVGRQELVVCAAVALLAGGAVAAAGPVGFVGVAVPHLVRRLVGVDQRWVLPLSALGGAALVLAADTVGRIVLRPAELEVGILTAVIGAPVLIAAARSARVTR